MNGLDDEEKTLRVDSSGKRVKGKLAPKAGRQGKVKGWFKPVPGSSAGLSPAKLRALADRLERSQKSATARVTPQGRREFDARVAVFLLAVSQALLAGAMIWYVSLG